MIIQGYKNILGWMIKRGQLFPFIRRFGINLSLQRLALIQLQIEQSIFFFERLFKFK